MFKNGFHIKQILDVDPNIKYTLDQISLWGGEPFLGIYRFLDHIEEWFSTFENLYKIDASTNLNLPDHYERLQDLLNAMEKMYDKYSKKDRKYFLQLQISIDGYKEMNDFGRGINSTKKIYENWQKILDNLKFNSDKIEIIVFTKPTFSKDSWHFVDTPDKAYRWCQSHEDNLFQPWKNSGQKFSYTNSLWNNALPTEYTKAEGIEYSKVSKAFYEISPEVIHKMDGYKMYPTVLSEAQLALGFLKDNNYNIDRYQKELMCKKCGGGCGVFAFNIVPIPHNLFTMCHRGLFDAYTEYSDNFKNYENFHNLAKSWSTADTKYWILNKEELLKMKNILSKTYEYSHQIWNTDLIQQIKYYADAGLIDKKYQDQQNIIPTLGYFLLNSTCIQDSFMFGGTWTTHSPLEIPLLYNGTMDIVIDEIHRVMRDRGAEL